MNEYITKIKLDHQVKESLHDIVSVFEHEIDALECIKESEEKQLVLLRERIFNMIKLVGSIEEDIEVRVQCLVAEYLNGFYAEISDIESYLERLRRIQHKQENYPFMEEINY